ncbi:MAG: winged helix-turn-helix transcriptional regulator [Acidobacteria bacterium]|nr:winged helix-turn-helix transcriptional regulator [Acidobacteriota bacterium]
MGTNVFERSADDVQRVLDGLRRIVQGLRESSRETERRTNLTAAQLFVLRQLADGDSLSVNDLAHRTFTHQSSVSVVAARLAARGLVERRRDARDRRRRILTLTTAGHQALKTAPPSAQERLIAAILSTTPAVRRSVGHALAVMADQMTVDRRPSMFFEERSRS